MQLCKRRNQVAKVTIKEKARARSKSNYRNTKLFTKILSRRVVPKPMWLKFKLIKINKIKTLIPQSH